MPFFRLAVESGINFFDTADMYSLGASEEVTGKALREFARLEECVVATKVFNAMGAGPQHVGACRASTSSRVARPASSGWASTRSTSTRSTASIRTRRIDEMLAALDLLVRQGKVRYLGASSMAGLAVLPSACRSRSDTAGPAS